MTEDELRADNLLWDVAPEFASSLMKAPPEWRTPTRLRRQIVLGPGDSTKVLDGLPWVTFEEIFCSGEPGGTVLGYQTFCPRTWPDNMYLLTRSGDTVCGLIEKRDNEKRSQ